MGWIDVTFRSLNIETFRTRNIFITLVALNTPIALIPRLTIATWRSSPRLTIEAFPHPWTFLTTSTFLSPQLPFSHHLDPSLILLSPLLLSPQLSSQLSTHHL